MRFRFVHAADLHLDTPFSGIGRADEAVARALRDASLDAWDALVELALSKRAAFLLLAGDIYDGPRRGLRAQLRFLGGVRRLAAAGVQVFVVHGNHDPLAGGWSAVSAWPEGTVIFAADGVAAVPVERDGERLATVYGVSFARADERRNLARLFARGPEPGLHVGLLHCNVGGDPEYGDYAPCGTADLIAARMDYWALGHVHRRRAVIPGDPCWAMYPGNLQGRSPAPGELGAKGALVVDCDSARGIVAEPRFVALDRARFLTPRVDATGAADLAGLVERIGDELERLRADPELAGRGLVARATAGGEPADPQLPQAAAADELLEQVRARAETLEPFVWCEGLRLALQAAVPREAVAGRGDFAADLVAASDELDRAGLQALLAEIDAGLPAGVRTECPADPAEARELLAEAEQECLRLLLAEAGAP